MKHNHKFGGKYDRSSHTDDKQEALLSAQAQHTGHRHIDIYKGDEGLLLSEMMDMQVN